MSWSTLPPLPFPAPQPEALHLVVSTDSGGLYATVREANGSWEPWIDVLAATAPLHSRTVGPPADNPAVDIIDSLALTTISGGCLLVVHIQPSIPWYSIWTPDNAWSTREGLHETEWPVAASLAGVGLATQYSLFAPAYGGLAMTGLEAGYFWTPWSNFPLAPPSTLPELPSASVNSIGVDLVGAALVAGVLHVVIGTWMDVTIVYSDNLATGCVWHTAQNADGSFSGWAQLPLKALLGFGAGHNDPPYPAAAHVDDSMAAIALADIGGTVHVGTLNTGGGIWHYTLGTTGSLSDGDYNQLYGYPAGAKHMAMCAVAGECHFVVASNDGGLWHTIRHNDGTWAPWGDVWGQVARLHGGIIALAAAGSTGSIRS